MTETLPIGQHMLADFYGCPILDDAALIERAMRSAADAAGATVIGLHLHHFGAGQGVTGVALLAESHMSIHSWPEHGYAALDIFLCGKADAAEQALQILKIMLRPQRVEWESHLRGQSIPSPEKG